MANATYKIRRPVLAMSELTAAGGLTIGTGVSASNIRFGESVVIASSPHASSACILTIAASGVAVTDMVFVTPASMGACMVFGGASCIVADTLSVTYYNRGAVESPNVDLTFQWLALR